MAKKKSTVSRRMGTAGSASWHLILDGAEDILREEGYAALTSRLVAERSGVGQRLVYYYFLTMDDLIVETIRRLSARELDRLRQALASEQPLRQIWDVCMHTIDVRLMSEFIALANRIPALKEEVTSFIKESRAMQGAALASALERRSMTSRIPPVGLALLAHSLALSLIRESGLGVTTGHSEILAVIGDFLSELEPDR
jgi:AcrR family transcriptional regulator